EEQQAVLGFCRLLRFSEHLRAVSGGHVDFLEVRLDVAHDFAQAPSGHAGTDVDPALVVLPLDDVERGLDADVGDVGESHRAAAGGVDREVANVGQAAACLGRAPDVDVVCPRASEDVSYFFAREQRGCRPAYVAGL